ncbi:Putative alpha-ketoglutarate-dependent sulfonate dioxygenase [Talaromyces islandicus]|uniref:Putative alpha-ketoglutarate-dependent sulfonate dioxygenase n=1 Tax=Talaromyces islandicus TaxID=28573 RepID=A0A0U1LXD9_TALIS|nr:Putative alpha-ketoglutarate-dependent sulfonate dioxygenase [Talaromyces islandicus]
MAQAKENPGPFPRFKGPLELTGALDKYESFEVTPVLGREYPTAKLLEWMNAPNSDELLRDLAITVSQRGVVVFRAQDGVDTEVIKKLAIRLGELTGRPSENGLHIHPLFNSERAHGGADNQINCVSSEDRKAVYAAEQHQKKKVQSHNNWHSDLGFEAVPGDYSVFVLTEVPETGGDTLFASGCDLYDRISTPMQKFLETLTAINASPKLEQIARDKEYSMYTEQRGCPQNVGTVFRHEHPVVRTNPVTGWKSIYALGQNTESIKDLAPEESSMLLDWIINILYKNHDTQARIRWKQNNDVAIWDNRSVFHCVTWDYDHLGPRMGKRALCVGERPYFDPNSTSRQETLGY